MSRLIEKLTRMRQTEPQPMGFMLGKTSEEKPRMQLIACFTPERLGPRSSDLDLADAIMIEVIKSDDLEALEKVCQGKETIPGGAWLKALSTGTIKKTMSAACDFVVFPATAPLTVVQKDKLGRILELDYSLGESLLRTANDLPIDAVLISTAETNITFDRIMQIQRAVYIISKPVLVSVLDSLSDVELQAIWDMGISGIVVDIADEKSLNKIAELRKTIEKLGPPASRKRDRIRPILPRIQAETPQPEEGDGEEEDE